MARSNAVFHWFDWLIGLIGLTPPLIDFQVLSPRGKTKLRRRPFQPGRTVQRRAGGGTGTWLYMVMHGYAWLYMVVHGYAWLYMVIHGYT